MFERCLECVLECLDSRCEDLLDCPVGRKDRAQVGWTFGKLGAEIFLKDCSSMVLSLRPCNLKHFIFILCQTFLWNNYPIEVIKVTSGVALTHQASWGFDAGKLASPSKSAPKKASMRFNMHWDMHWSNWALWDTESWFLRCNPRGIFSLLTLQTLCSVLSHVEPGRLNWPTWPDLKLVAPPQPRCNDVHPKVSHPICQCFMNLSTPWCKHIQRLCGFQQAK